MNQETTITRPAPQAAGASQHFGNQHEVRDVGVKRRIPDFAFELVVYCSVCSLLLSFLHYVDQLVG